MSDAERIAVIIGAGNVAYVLITFVLVIFLGALPASVFLPPYGDVTGVLVRTWLLIGGFFVVADLLLILSLVSSVVDDFRW
jgi:hypothetical protein